MKFSRSKAHTVSYQDTPRTTTRLRNPPSEHKDDKGPLGVPCRPTCVTKAVVEIHRRVNDSKLRETANSIDALLMAAVAEEHSVANLPGWLPHQKPAAEPPSRRASLGSMAATQEAISTASLRTASTTTTSSGEARPPGAEGNARPFLRQGAAPGPGLGAALRALT